MLVYPSSVCVYLQTGHLFCMCLSADRTACCPQAFLESIHASHSNL